MLRPAVSSCPAGREKAFTCEGSGGTRQHPGSFSLRGSGASSHRRSGKHRHVCLAPALGTGSARRSREHTSRRAPCEFRGGGQTAERCAGTAVPELPPLSLLDPRFYPRHRGTWLPPACAAHSTTPDRDSQPAHAALHLHAAQPIRTHTTTHIHTHTCLCPFTHNTEPQAPSLPSRTHKHTAGEVAQSR